jgi:hypothetical protein
MKMEMNKKHNNEIENQLYMAINLINDLPLEENAISEHKKDKLKEMFRQYVNERVWAETFLLGDYQACHVDAVINMVADEAFNTVNRMLGAMCEDVAERTFGSNNEGSTTEGEEEPQRWYYASYTAIGDDDFDPDGDYFTAPNNESALKVAMTMAKNGQDYEDLGHVDLQLLSLTRVDADNDYEEIETVWC